MVLSPTKASSPQSTNLDTLHSTGPDDDDEEFIPESAHKKKVTLVNNCAPPQGSNMERPMGINNAKLIKKLEDSGVLLSVAPGLLTDLFDTRNAEGENKMMANMLSATRELFSVLKAATSNKQDELRMRTHEKWMKMASIYAMCGQHDLALSTMKKIEDDEDQLAASKAAAQNHDSPKEQVEQ
jgi:hypothetical protein